MSTLARKLILDACLTVALVFEMLYQLTGDTLHEVAGAAFVACIIVHMLLARRWIAKTAGAMKAGRAAVQQKRLLVVACLLLVDVVLLAFSSVVISQKLWDAGADFTFLNPNNIWYPLHTATAYIMCILVLAHLSMHWKVVADTLKIEYDPSRREAITSAANGIVMVGGIALTVVGAIRSGLQVTDLVVVPDENDGSSTVESGYRERNAQTGDYTTDVAFEVTDSATAEANAEAEDASADADKCPLCPRQCKLSAPRCTRPYEAGLIT